MSAAVVVGAPTWTVHTPLFDGPLDLLLYLVQRDGIDLAELEVAHIADSYLAYLDGMRRMNLAIAGDYLVMAATLVHLKSLALLPRPPTPAAEGEPDPAAALAEQLRAYEVFRRGAAELDGRPWLGRDVFGPGVTETTPAGPRPLGPGDPYALLEVFAGLLARAEEPPPTVTLKPSGPNLGTAAWNLLALLGGPGGQADLARLLAELPTRAERVVTFVGALEMLRLGWLELIAATHLGPVEIVRRVADEDVDLGALWGFVEHAGDDPQPDLPLGGKGG